MTERVYDRYSTDFGEHKGFVHSLARKYMPRVHNARLPMEIEDVIGELSIAFLAAGEKYDRSKGYAFTTYFGMCAQNHMNKVLGKMSREQYGEEVPDADCIAGERTTKSGLGLMSFSDIQTQDGGDPLDFLFPDDSASPEDRVDAFHRVQSIIEDNTLLPETRAYIGLLVNPSMIDDDDRREKVLARIDAAGDRVMAEIKGRWGVSMRSL